LRDRALIATLTYSFARITAALRMKVEDLRPKGAGWQILLHEKGGKEHAMPCHHALADVLAPTSILPASPTTIHRGSSGDEGICAGSGHRARHDAVIVGAVKPRHPSRSLFQRCRLVAQRAEEYPHP
jgi:hypothetical protein